MRTIKKQKWYRRDEPWLGNDIPADPLADLCTTDNSLSVYQVDDDKSNVKRIVTALAAGRHHLDKIDYALVDRQTVFEIGISADQTLGTTFDRMVNEWHFHLARLTASKLVELARAIMREDGNKQRLLQKEVRERILDAINRGVIDSHRLSPELQRKLG